MFLALSNWWVVGCGKVGMDVPVKSLAARMTHFAVGGRLSKPFVSLYVLRCASTIEQRDLT